LNIKKSVKADKEYYEDEEKLTKKGHDEFSDEDKDIFYELAKFNQLKIWENTPEVEQNKELKVFLKTFSKNKNNFKN